MLQQPDGGLTNNSRPVAQQLHGAACQRAIEKRHPCRSVSTPHQHPFDACAMITAGDITLVVDAVSTSYGTGDVFRLPAGTPHHEAAGPQGVSYLSGRRPVAAA